MDIKNKIKLIHKGRGNSWLKVINTSGVYQRIIHKIENLDSSSIVSYFEKEGFGWISNEFQQCSTSIEIIHRYSRTNKINYSKDGRFNILLFHVFF